MLFGKKKKMEFDPAIYEPCVRASICTGERAAGMREKPTGKFIELMLIKSDADLIGFCRDYGVSRKDIKTIY